MIAIIFCIYLRTITTFGYIKKTFTEKDSGQSEPAPTKNEWGLVGNEFFLVDVHVP
jgi:hypothetical protein